MMNRIAGYLFIGFFIANVYACKTHKLKVVFLEEKEMVEVKANSACRNSNILPLSNEEELKNNIHNSVTASIKKVKLKTNKEKNKATLKTNKVEFVINETCQATGSNQTFSYKILQKVSIENIATKEIFIFESDTLINNQKLNTNQLAVKKVDIAKYISPLTESNYVKAKNYFRQKK